MRYVVRVGLFVALIYACVGSFVAHATEESSEGQAKAVGKEAAGVSVTGAPQVWEDFSADTGSMGVNENRGNWFFKSQILKKAINPVKDVQRVVKDIAPFQKIFADRHKSLRADLAAFYQDYGFQEADVAVQRGLITEEIARNEQRLRQPVVPVKKEIKTGELKTGVNRPVQPPLPNPSDEIKRLKNNLVDIDKLAKLMARVQAIESAADQSIQMLTELIKGSHEFETGAWRDYEKIADTLSDVVAEERYRAIEAALTNAQGVKQYCAETFERFFSGLVQEVSGLEAEIKPAIDSLRDRGYAFGKLASEKLEAERKAAQEAARLKALKSAKKPEPVTFWGRISGYFSAVWQWIIHWFK